MITHTSVSYVREDELQSVHIVCLDGATYQLVEASELWEDPVVCEYGGDFRYYPVTIGLRTFGSLDAARAEMHRLFPWARADQTAAGGTTLPAGIR